MQALTLNRKPIKINFNLIPYNTLHIRKGLYSTTSIEKIVENIIADYKEALYTKGELTNVDIRTITEAVTRAIDLNTTTWLELDNSLCISVCPDSKVKQEALDCYDGRDDESVAYYGMEIYETVFKTSPQVLNELKALNLVKSGKTEEQRCKYLCKLMESDDSLFSKILKVYVESSNNEYLFESEIYWDEGVFSKFTTKGQTFYTVIRDC